MPSTELSSMTIGMNMSTIVEIKQKLNSQASTRTKLAISQCEIILFGRQVFYPTDYAPTPIHHTPAFSSTHHLPSSKHLISNTNNQTQSIPATPTNEESSNRSQTNTKNPKSLQTNTKNASSSTNHTPTQKDHTSPSTDRTFASTVSSGLSEKQARLQEKKFCNYWHAKSGKEALKDNWQATKRNWSQSEIERIKDHQERLAMFSSHTSPATSWSDNDAFYRSLINDHRNEHEYHC
ncbi:hypothetical protein AT246_06830 [Bartonella henselae]|nr:hypothetical protein AT247_07685 [Bartonella henselae]OLL50846.1 hypothetical protein AT243_00080 [Bartonella henselae]OLL51140.1 hypothetical protein AT241_06160 [Bartonella henselae]OLL58033.1 hypothetical protein AT246_06830 [Bartonella henselae]